jgi:hypothetical protein
MARVKWTLEKHEYREENLFIHDMDSSVMAPRKGSQPNCNAGKMLGEQSCSIPFALLDLLLCEKSVNVL